MGWFSKKKKEEKAPEIPSYQGTFPQEATALKQAVSGTTTKFELPMRKPQVTPVKMMTTPAPKPRGDDSLFIKINQYDEAMNLITQVKDKLKDASSILKNLDEIKRQEDQELEAWHRDLEDIKSKLMEVDQNLFD